MAVHHITIREDIRKNPEAKPRAFERVLETSGIRNVNQKRFERYGIITGELDEDRLPALLRIEEVGAVEADQRRYAAKA